MDVTSITPEIMEHARGALTFESGESTMPVSGVTAYQCKIYKARLEQASASDYMVRTLASKNRNYRSDRDFR